MDKLRFRMFKCTAKKRVKVFEWFKDKMLLAQAQEAGVVLNDEQHDFLADSLEETNDSTTNAIFMTNLSPVGSINDDTVEPHYDSDILSKVSHYDTYHESEVLNYDIQELEYIENIVSNNEAYDELTSNNNVISYADCMVTIGNDEDNYVPPPVQNNYRILSIIEHMKTQVEKCSMVNQETQSVNESLTSDLEQYKERVKTLENKSKNYAFDREKFLDCELRTVILCDTEETLILTEESRLKMLEKQTVINTKLIDYSKLNKLYDDLVPQKQLSAEQLYWSLTPSPPESVSKPAKVFPKKLPSTGQVLKNLNNARDLLRVSSTNASRSKPMSNTKNDRIQKKSSRSMMNKVEAQPRKFKSSANKNNHVSDCNVNVKNVALSNNSDTICLSCNECLFSGNHDACVVQYQKNIVEIVLWYLHFRCSKHMTGHSDKLINFVSMFIGTVRFGNDHFAAIMGYGDLQMGNILISRVYYVEGLGHNLFFVGQFYDLDLKVAFRKQTQTWLSNLEVLSTIGSRVLTLYNLHGRIERMSFI
ncbi:hypothetical protein Tco_1115907 [Tanacetum coccineum]